MKQRHKHLWQFQPCPKALQSIMDQYFLMGGCCHDTDTPKQATAQKTNKQNLPKTAKANQTAKYPMFSQPADHPSHRTGCEVRSHHQNLGFGHLNLQSKVRLSPLLKVLCPTLVFVMCSWFLRSLYSKWLRNTATPFSCAASEAPMRVRKAFTVALRLCTACGESGSRAAELIMARSVDGSSIGEDRRGSRYELSEPLGISWKHLFLLVHQAATSYPNHWLEKVTKNPKPSWWCFGPLQIFSPI